MENYEMIRVIGEGSFGKVYLMRHKSMRKMMCVKVIKIRNIPRKEREACKAEVELLKRLKHPNIVSYYDSFLTKTRESLCIVMEYADGGDLAGRISKAKKRVLPETQVLHWFVQMCLGLHYMHEKRVLHRDLKTQNIFLLGNGRLVLGDLGISKVLDGTMDFAQTCIGTPYYMSPEIFKNKPYNHKSDIWALGCVLYEMATLKHAFNANSLNGLAVKIIKGRYMPIPDKYSNHLRELVNQMLDINPLRRPDLETILKKPFIKKHVTNFLSDIVQRPQANIGEGTMVVRAAAVNLVADSRGSKTPYMEAGLKHADITALTKQLGQLQMQSCVSKALAPPESSKPAAPEQAVKMVKQQKSALRREEERKRQVEEALQRLRDERNARMQARQKALDDRKNRGRLGVQGHNKYDRRRGAAAVKKPAAARNSRPQAQGYGRDHRDHRGGYGGGGGAQGDARRAPQREAQSDRGKLPRRKASHGGGHQRARSQYDADGRHQVAELDRWEDRQSAKSERAREAQRLADEALRKREQQIREAKIREDQERREAVRNRERERQREEMERLRQDKLELDRREQEMKLLREKRKERERQRVAEERRERERQRELEEAAAREAKELEAKREREMAEAMSAKERVLQRKLQRQKEEEERRRAELREAERANAQQRMEAAQKQKLQYMDMETRKKELRSRNVSAVTLADDHYDQKSEEEEEEEQGLPPLHNRNSPHAMAAPKKGPANYEDNLMSKLEDATKGVRSRFASDARDADSSSHGDRSNSSLPGIQNGRDSYSQAGGSDDESDGGDPLDELTKESDDEDSDSEGWATPDVDKEDELEDMDQREQELQEELNKATVRCETIKKTIQEHKSFILQSTAKGGEQKGSPSALQTHKKQDQSQRFPGLPQVPDEGESEEEEDEDEDLDELSEEEKDDIHGIAGAIVEEEYSSEEFESDGEAEAREIRRNPRVVPETEDGANELISEAKGGAEEEYSPQDNDAQYGNTPSSPEGRLKERVRVLKQRCIDGLGNSAFQRAYQYLKMVQMEQDDNNDAYDMGQDEEERVIKALTEIMGKDKLHYWSLIDQLIFMEDTHLT